MSKVPSTQDLDPDGTGAGLSDGRISAHTGNVAPMNARYNALDDEKRAGLHQKRGQTALRLNIPEAQLTPPRTYPHSASKEKDDEPASAHTTPVKENRKASWIPRPDFSWVQVNLKLSRLKCVFRCAIGAWISVLLVLIPRTQQVLGKVSSPWVKCTQTANG